MGKVTNLIEPGTEQSFFWEWSGAVRIEGFFVSFPDEDHEDSIFQLQVRGFRVGVMSLFPSTNTIELALFRRLRFVPWLEVTPKTLVMVDVANYYAKRPYNLTLEPMIRA